MVEIKLGKYKHYKGKYYQVIGVAYHSKTLEKFVIYKALYDSKEFGKNALWARSIKNFLEKLEIKGKRVSRFKLINR